jgi:TetR/AcrR family transcriptional regulator, transcriptional repressor for nem operon
VARPREFDEIEAVRLASRTFWVRGYQATSIRDLEEATGLTAGSIYKAYGSKRELFLLCLEQYMKEDSYLALLLTMFDKPLEASLRKIFDTIIDSTADTSTRPAGCLVTNLVLELLNVDGELGEDAAAGLAEMQKALRFRIKWAQESGELRADRDSSALGAYFMVVIQGMLLISTSTKDTSALKAAREVALTALH